VLLQVLFHARIAEDAPLHPFTIDDVADSLGAQARQPVPGRCSPASRSRWTTARPMGGAKGARKAGEVAPFRHRRRAHRQPALGVGEKVIERITPAGLPADLIPGAITSVTVSADSDAENALRSAVLEFMTPSAASSRRSPRAAGVRTYPWNSMWRRSGDLRGGVAGVLPPGGRGHEPRPTNPRADAGRRPRARTVEVPSGVRSKS